MIHSDIVYSQPADTGTGVNVNTQLVYAVNHLKVRFNQKELSATSAEVISGYTKPHALAGHRHCHKYTIRY